MHVLKKGAKSETEELEFFFQYCSNANSLQMPRYSEVGVIKYVDIACLGNQIIYFLCEKQNRMYDWMYFACKYNVGQIPWKSVWPICSNLQLNIVQDIEMPDLKIQSFPPQYPLLPVINEDYDWGPDAATPGPTPNNTV